MKTIGNYALQVTTSLEFEPAIARARELLAEQGFGVLTEIDVAATLKEKIGIDRPPYYILGSCNPPLAHRALESEPYVGVFLPCNVVIWDAGDHRVVAAMEPRIMADVIGSRSLGSVADEVSRRLREVLAKF